MFLVGLPEQEWASFRAQDQSSPSSQTAPPAAQQPQTAVDPAKSSSQTGPASSQAAPQALSPESNVPQYFVPSDYAYFTAEKKPEPHYPPDAATRKLGGEVVLAVGYLTDGEVWGVERIVGEPILADAAAEAVRTWKFRPLKQKGQKIRGVTYVGFYFEQPEGLVISAFPYGKWKREEPATASANSAQFVRLGSGVVAGQKLRGENPRYPDSAKHDRVQGVVMMRATIDKEGHVSLLE